MLTVLPAEGGLPALEVLFTADAAEVEAFLEGLEGAAHVGLDLEWRPTFAKGPPSRPALLQLGTGDCAQTSLRMIRFRLQSSGSLRSASLCSFSEAAFPRIFVPISRFSHENLIFRIFFSSFENRRPWDDSCTNPIRRPGPFLVASRAIHRVNYIISAKNMGTFRTAPRAGASRGHRVSSSLQWVQGNVPDPWQGEP